MHEGERARRIRESLGLQQKYVASQLGISPSALGRVESGETLMSYRLAVKLARIYNCNLDAFDDALGGPLRPIVPPPAR